MNVKAKLNELGVVLPTPPTPVASYVSVVRTGNLLYVSGQGPVINGKQLYAGKVGAELTIKQGVEAARACALNLLAQLDSYLGGLDKVKQVVHLKGFVASADDFTAQPTVINGASDLMVEVFGEAGKHSRCALGVNVLPTDIPVEVELIVEI